MMIIMLYSISSLSIGRVLICFIMSSLDRSQTRQIFTYLIMRNRFLWEKFKAIDETDIVTKIYNLKYKF